MAVLIVFILFLRFFIGLGRGTYEWDTEDSIPDIISYVMTGVAVVAVAIPEGLPVSITLVLAFSVKKMQNDHNFVKNT